MFIFGLGYAANHIARALSAKGWEVISTGAAGSLAFDDAASVRLGLADATHILSSVPPMSDGDPVLEIYGPDIARNSGAWRGYLSSTGVYGDAGGAWVDEAAPIKGRRANRNEADAAWLDLGARVFRLPGIYGPGRSALDRVAEGRAHRIDLPDQVFSRIHVDDIAGILLASMARPHPGTAYNVADDDPCPPQDVVEHAAELLGKPVPPAIAFADAELSPMARSFYADSKRVANRRVKEELGYRFLYPSFHEGLAALLPGAGKPQ